MSSTVSVPPSAPEATALSEPARIINTYVAPTKTFSDLRRSAAWWGPFLLMCLSSVAFIYTVDKKIGFQQVATNQIQMSPKLASQVERLSPPDRELDLHRRTVGTRYIAYGFPIVILLINLIFTAVLFATFKFGLSAQLRFSATFAVLMYATLPGILRSVLAIGSILAGASTDSFVLQNPIATNPGYFLNPADSAWLYSLASSFDLFRFWTLILVAIGISCVSKVKRSTSFLVVFGWFIIVTLIGTALTAAFS